MAQSKEQELLAVRLQIDELTFEIKKRQRGVKSPTERQKLVTKPEHDRLVELISHRNELERDIAND